MTSDSELAVVTADRGLGINLDQVANRSWHADDFTLLVVKWVWMCRLKGLNICRIHTFVVGR